MLCTTIHVKNRPIRALIADDEALARKFIRRMLKDDRDFEITGECGNGKETVAMIRKESPDVVFLDVQMPEMDGFAVLESIGIERLPEIIFATAYEQYAIRAFELHALDYLLKPFDHARFKDAIKYAKKRFRSERQLHAGDTVRARLRCWRGQRPAAGEDCPTDGNAGNGITIGVTHLYAEQGRERSPCGRRLSIATR